MRLPEVKDMLIHISTYNHCPTDISDQLRKLAAEITRRKPFNRGNVKSRPVTDELRKQIRQYFFDNPGLTQLEVGRKFNVNQGRVSEAIRGFRK